MSALKSFQIETVLRVRHGNKVRHCALVSENREDWIATAFGSGSLVTRGSKEGEFEEVRGYGMIPWKCTMGDGERLEASDNVVKNGGCQKLSNYNC